MVRSNSRVKEVNLSLDARRKLWILQAVGAYIGYHICLLAVVVGTVIGYGMKFLPGVPTVLHGVLFGVVLFCTYIISYQFSIQRLDTQANNVVYYDEHFILIVFIVTGPLMATLFYLFHDLFFGLETGWFGFVSAALFIAFVAILAKQYSYLQPIYKRLPLILSLCLLIVAVILVLWVSLVMVSQ